MPKAQEYIRYAGEHGSLEATRICKGHLLMVLAGSVDEHSFDAVISEIEGVLHEDRKLSLYVEMERLNAYTSEFRERWTAWIIRHRDEIPAIHVYATSRIVLMAARLVSLVAEKEISVHPTRESFDELVRRLNPLILAQLRASRDSLSI